MKLKNILLSGLSLVLVAALAIGGTVAYLQDDDSDVNVMTLGNVKIEQHEYERVVNADGTFATDTIDDVTSYVLKDFTQGKPLLPSTVVVSSTNWDSTVVRMTQVDSYGSMNTFLPITNAQDKFVTVENTGKTDAYIRTLVAIEVGTADASLIGTSYHKTWTENEVGTISVDGNKYYVTEYVYAGGQLSDGSWRHQYGILPAGDTSYPNLSQVYIKPEATNEDMEKLDGNGNGTLDILVLSQAVQAAGFADAQTALDTAFGDATATTVAEWFDGSVIPSAVSTAAELKAAIVNGDDVVLTDDITVDEAIEIPAGVTATIDLNGNTLTGSEYTTSSGTTSLNNVFVNNGELTITGSGEIRTRNIINNPGAKLVIDGNIKIIGGNPAGGGSAIWNEGDCVIKNVTIEQVNTGNYAIQNVADNSTMVIENAKVVSKHGAITNLGANASLVVNGGYYEVTGASTDHIIYAPAGTVTINGGSYNLSQANASSMGSTIIDVDGAVTINGGTFDSVSGAFAYNADSVLVINGGKFLNKAATVYGGDFAQFVATTSTATTNADGSVTVTEN